MEAIIERCCGLDVHRASVVACLLVGAASQKPKKVVRTFGTMTRDLETLAAWLQAEGCTHVGMESTGIYWKPVYSVLEGRFELIVGNAQHIKNVPGRKTDVRDSEWIADLVRHGLIRKSFVPPQPLRELRDLLRYRTKLIQNRTSERNRLIKLLESANIKLSGVATNVFGLSGMLMLKALVQGETSPQQMADLARGRLRKKLPELQLALDGRLEDHHRFILDMQVKRLEKIEQDIEHLDQRIDARLEPYRVQHSLLLEIPGVDRVVAAVIIAEIGVDMSTFPTSQALAGWAGVCPGNNESAGKRKGGGSRKGNAHLRTILVQAATAASRAKGTYLKDKYHRLKARRGAQRAAMAIAHRILVSAHRMLSQNVGYNELGEAYLDQLSEKRVTDNLVRRLERLGYQVTLAKPSPPPPPHADGLNAA